MISPTTLLAKLLTGELGEKELKLIEFTAKELADRALKSKVLLFFALKIKELGVDDLLPENIKKCAESLKKRLKIHLDLIDKLSRIAYSQGFNHVIVKTIKPYPYVGDDIDILLDAKDYRSFIKSVVNELDFKIEGYGQAETTLYKYFEGFEIKIDVHHKLAASTLSYVDTYSVLRTKQRKFACFNEDCIETYVPSPEYAILITSGHAILKELRVSLADVLDIWHWSKHISTQMLWKLAKYEGLTETLKVMREYVRATLMPREVIDLPCRVSVSKLTKCYTEKIANALGKGKYYEVVKMPLTNIKGYGILLRYIKGHG